jgi:hypothetical protein
MEGDAEIRRKETALAALREEASRIVAAASSEGRELTQEEDSQVLALMSQARALEDEIHRRTKRRTAD